MATDIQITNNASGSLLIGINDLVTALQLQVGEGAEFPTITGNQYFYATITDVAGNYEIIKVTAVSGDQFTTIVRGQDNTLAQAWVSSSIVSLRPCAALFEDIIDELQAGTPATSFQIDNDNTGPRIKNNSGLLEIKNDSDTAFADVTAANIIAYGAVDNFVLLDADGAISICDSAAAGAINFKSVAADAYDCRIMQSSDGLEFYTGGNGSTVKALTIDSSQDITMSSGDLTLIGGSMLIGGGVAANQLLSVYEASSGAAATRFMNATTGIGAANGVLVGITADEKAQLWNYGNTDVQIAANNAEGLRLNASGLVSIGGATSPANQYLNIYAAGSGAVNTQYMNVITGTTATSGVLVGITASEKAQIWNYGNTDMVFATNNLERMRIDNNGGVALGGITAPINALLNLYSDSSGEVFSYFQNSTTNITSTDGFKIGISDDEKAQLWNYGNTDVQIAANNAEGLRLNASGNVSIGGSSSPDNQYLNIYSAGSGAVNTQYMNVVTGTTATSGVLVGIKATDKAQIWNYGNTNMVFATNNLERMTIKAAGTVDIANNLTVVNIDASGTVDIGASTTRRVAPAGTFVNNANENPNISDTALVISSAIAIDTWESIGDTSSGADNIWTPMDLVPTDADWIQVKIITAGRSTSVAVNEDQYMSVYSRAAGGNDEPIGIDNKVSITAAYTNCSGNAVSYNITYPILQVNSSQIFDMYWTNTFETAITLQMYLIGWGFNP